VIKLKRCYSVELKSHIWYPGNYKDHFRVKIDTEDKELTEYLEEKVMEAINGFEEYKKGVKE